MVAERNSSSLGYILELLESQTRTHLVEEENSKGLRCEPGLTDIEMRGRVRMGVHPIILVTQSLLSSAFSRF